MFFILPIGHDQETYSRPYITYAIALLCLLVQIWTTAQETTHALAVRDAAAAFDAEFALDEDARIGPEVAAELPATLRRSLDTIIAEDADDEAIDADLEATALALGTAARRIPSLQLGYTPADSRPHTLVTYQFAHGGWMHLVGNLLFLLVAGGVLECFWRSWAYALLFLLAGIGGAILHGVVTDDATIPLVGASGSIAGLMAAFLLGHARAKVHLFVFVWLFLFIRSFKVSIVAMYLIPIWVAVQVWSMIGGSAGGVSYGAHVGGFVAGLLVGLAARQLGLIARDDGYS